MRRVVDMNTLLLQSEMFYNFTLQTRTLRVLNQEKGIKIIKLYINIDHEVKMHEPTVIHGLKYTNKIHACLVSTTLAYL